MTTQANRTINAFNNNVILECGSSTVGVAGAAAFTFQSVNNSEVHFNVGLYDSGMTSVEAEGNLQIQGGIKSQKGDRAVSIIAHKGDMILQAVTDGSWVRIKGKNIAIEATNQLALTANDIQIGHKTGDTKSIQMNAYKIDLGKPKDGNMSDILKTRSLANAFSKSMVADIVMGSLGTNTNIGL